MGLKGIKKALKNKLVYITAFSTLFVSSLMFSKFFTPEASAGGCPPYCAPTCYDKKQDDKIGQNTQDIWLNNMRDNIQQNLIENNYFLDMIQQDLIENNYEWDWRQQGELNQHNRRINLNSMAIGNNYILDAFQQGQLINHEFRLDRAENDIDYLEGWNESQDEAIETERERNDDQDVILDDHDNRIGQNKEDIRKVNKRVDNLEDRVGRLEDTQYIFEGAIRIYDGSKWEISAYGQYNFREEEIREVGVRATYKLGESYEQGLIEKQNEEIRALKSLVHQLAGIPEPVNQEVSARPSARQGRRGRGRQEKSVVTVNPDIGNKGFIVKAEKAF